MIDYATQARFKSLPIYLHTEMNENQWLCGTVEKVHLKKLKLYSMHSKIVR